MYITKAAPKTTNFAELRRPFVSEEILQKISMHLDTELIEFNCVQQFKSTVQDYENIRRILDDLAKQVEDADGSFVVTILLTLVWCHEGCTNIDL